MRSVFKDVQMALNVRLCSHSRKDNHGELHFILGIINSPNPEIKAGH